MNRDAEQCQDDAREALDAALKAYVDVNLNAEVAKALAGNGFITTRGLIHKQYLERHPSLRSTPPLEMAFEYGIGKTFALCDVIDLGVDVIEKIDDDPEGYVESGTQFASALRELADRIDALLAPHKDEGNV